MQAGALADENHQVFDMPAGDDKVFERVVCEIPGQAVPPILCVCPLQERRCVSPCRLASVAQAVGSADLVRPRTSR